MLKKILVYMSMLLSALLIVSCSKDNSVVKNTDTDLYDEILKKGEIIIAMEGTWSPWTYHDENNELVGYDVEVGKAIASEMGVKPVFIEGEWDGLLAGLAAGRYDIMINGVDITAERKMAYDFTIPYAYMKTAIMVDSDNDDINSFSDLKGKITANTISSTYADLARENGADVIGVDDLNQTFELLKQKRIDATLNSEVTFYDYKKIYPEANIKIAALSDTANEIGIPIKKGNEKLVNRINEILEKLRNNGTLSQISNKYFSVDIGQK